MTLDLKSIFAREGSSFPISYSLDLQAFEWMGQQPLKDPIRIEGAVTNQAGVVLLKLECTVDFMAPCDRCGKEARQRYMIPVNRTLVTQLANEIDPESDLLLLPDAMLDVDALCTEEIVLNLPTKHLCRETCKGVCAICGKDLNEGDCACPKTSVDPRLAALQSFLD